MTGEDVEELRKEVEELKERLDESEGSKEEFGFGESGESLSRRDFLKGALGGTAAAGAMAMLPSTSALDFESGSGFSFSNQSSKNFELGSSGDLNLKGGDIQNAGAANVDKLSVGGDGPAESFSEIGGVSGVADAVVKLENGIPTAYRADGSEIAQDSDAAVAMQAAIDQIGSGSIYVGAGEFPMNSDINIRSNLTIVGQGTGLTVFRAQSEAGWFKAGGVFPLENLHLQDFTFDGNNQGGLTRMFFKGQPKRCSGLRIGVLNCGDRGSSGTSSGGFGFFSGSATPKSGWNKMVNCYAYNCAYVSLSMQKFQFNSIIQGCIVEDPYPSGFTHPISIESNTNSKVVNCTVIGGDRNGPNPAINANATKNCVVDGNTIEGAVKGINIANASPGQRTVVSNNSIKNVSEYGILVRPSGGSEQVPEENLIIGNSIENTEEAGIRFKNGGGSHVIANVLVNVNSTGNSQAMKCSSEKPKMIANNVVRESGNNTDLSIGHDESKYPDGMDVAVNNELNRSAAATSPFIFRGNIVQSLYCSAAGLIQNNYVRGGPLQYSDDASTIVSGNYVGGSIENTNGNEASPQNAIIGKNSGYVTENSGSASVADGGTIAHGLSLTPNYVNVTTTTKGTIAAVSNVDGTNITIELFDSGGSSISTAESVYWEAKLR